MTTSSGRANQKKKPQNGAVAKDNRFRPHLWVKGEREIPSPVFVAALCGIERFLKVSLPKGITKLAWERQKFLVESAAVRFFRRQKGQAGPFGSITGFYYRPTTSVTFDVSVTGQVTGAVSCRPVLISCSLRPEGKEGVSLRIS